VLQAFGARIGPNVRVYPHAKIWAPWNLTMGPNSTMDNGVWCYCVAPVTIGAHATVSADAVLCTATHDYTDPTFPLVSRPINIGEDCWIAADVFVGPGVEIGDGTVVGARSSVFSNLPDWSVCVGTPAKPVKRRSFSQGDAS